MTTPAPDDGLVLRAHTVPPGSTGPVVSVVPGTDGWRYAGLDVHDVAAGGQVEVALRGRELLVLPLRGGCDVEVTTADGATQRVRLAGRVSPFAGPSDAVYVPLGARAVLHAADGACRVAVAHAPARSTRPVRVLHAADVPVELRGAGRASRQVQDYTIGTDVEVDHLLVCEVLTPGGNWSSYPPHKHDEHSEHERELEEVYYFEVADGPDGPGLAYQQVYGTAERPVQVLAEVRTGDAVLVPHGYHGPAMAAPGYDLYYLNVMAGPSTDGRWLAVDDPAHHWVRSTWTDDDVDPRLPLRAQPAPSTTEVHP